ncbi:MAG: hypothetical protein ACC653_04660 [Gammaproteobacteria bacterium]
MKYSKTATKCDIDEGAFNGIIVKLPNFEIDKFEVILEQLFIER